MTNDYFDITLDGSEGNYAFIDWKDNMEILDKNPSVYYSIVCQGVNSEEIAQMEEKPYCSQDKSNI